MQRGKKLSTQVKEKVEKDTKQEKKEEAFEGNTDVMVSTGSTLLDLAISGTRKTGGGIPGGIFVEIFGPSGCGKTVLLCEIAGAVQRQDGQIRFDDPEARLNKKFAEMFDMNVDEVEIGTPDTVTEIFSAINKWEPEDEDVINGTFTDSLAALSTDMEMDNEDGDKMGMRRAKEFSEGFRKNCRILSKKNYLMVASNQIRQKAGAMSFGEQTTSPGGMGIAFYASLRLKAKQSVKIQKKVRRNGKELKRPIGIRSEFEVYKSSIDKPYRTAWVSILFDYGVDDIRENLQFVKDNTSEKVFTVNGTPLDKSLEKSIEMVEEQGSEKELKKQTIKLWKDIESNFETSRKKKQR